MKSFLTTGIIIVSSLLGATLIISNVNASPGCYGIDQGGNTLDLSGLCAPPSNSNSVPSTPVNSNVNPEEKTDLNNNKTPEESAREETEKDIQSCFSSAACTQMMGGGGEAEKTPHQIRIEQGLNGGRINRN